MSTSQNDPNQNPLAALEDLLKKTQASAGEGGLSPDPAQVAASEEAEAKARLAQAQALAQELSAKNLEEDAQQISVQRRALEGIKETPEYQARVAQQEEATQTQTEEHDEQESYEIRQLEHKKV